MADESNRFDRCHRSNPRDTHGTGEEGNVLEPPRTGGVRDLTGVSDHEHRRLEAPFDADEQRTRRSAPAEAYVGDAVIIDVGTRAQYVHGTLQVLDHLDLLGRIPGEKRQRSSAARKWRVDRDD